MKRALQAIISLGITVGSFAWTFKDTKWHELKESLLRANYLWLLPYLAILIAVHLARTLRWGNLLSPLEKVPFKSLNEAAGIGFMMLIVLPFRMGEFARPFLIAQRTQIRRSPAMTSVVFERIVDGVLIGILLRVLAFYLPPETPGLGAVTVGANLMFGVFFSGFCFLLLARWQHERTLAVLRKLFGLVSPKLAERVVYVVDGFVGALRQLPDAKNLTSFIVFTAFYWAINGWGMSVLANAFDLNLSVYQGFVVLSVLVCGMMIPAAPGSAGTFQASIVLALGLFLPEGVVNSTGVAYANVLWLTQIVQQIAVGLVLMALSKTSFSAVAGKLGEEQAQA